LYRFYKDEKFGKGVLCIVILMKNLSCPRDTKKILITAISQKKIKQNF